MFSRWVNTLVGRKTLEREAGGSIIEGAEVSRPQRGGRRPPVAEVIAFMDDHREAHGVEPMCRALDIAPSTRHAHAARKTRPDLRSKRAKEDERFGSAILQIDQQVSRVVETTTSGIDSPAINQRRLTTTVAVHGGETVALGGLIEEIRNNNTSGLPHLARLPIIGPLFGTRSDQTQRTELLVLLTPPMLYDRVDAREAMICGGACGS